MKQIEMMSVAGFPCHALLDGTYVCGQGGCNCQMSFRFMKNSYCFYINMAIFLCKGWLILSLGKV